jgi:hypothetical protein
MLLEVATTGLSGDSQQLQRRNIRCISEGDLTCCSDVTDAGDPCRATSRTLGVTTVRLRFLGKESTPTNSPTLYATDQDSYVVQGWIITDPAVLARHDLPDDEALAEVPPALLKYLSLDGLDGEVSRLTDPIVDTMPNGKLRDPRKASDRRRDAKPDDIPDHETCVLVTKPAVAALLTSG